jgi:catechol O-methyltransferase
MAASSPSNTPFFYHHVPKNILLILLSWICLPLTTTITLISLIITHLNPPSKPPLTQDDFTRKTVLVTGTSMTKGLAIARLLALHTPHRIITADTEPIPFTSPGRYSSSITRFHQLASPNGEDAEPYIESLLSVIRRESVHLWISCSSVVGEVEDGEVMKRATAERGAQNFKAVQFSAQHVERLHEKDQFTTYIASLGLATPESHRCTSASEAEHFLTTSDLKEGKGKQFIMKPIGVDDRARAQMMTLLPLSSPQKTSAHLSSLNISEKNSYLLQQYISGPEYCTHALIIRGRVRAFTACPSLELLMHYEALSPDSPLTRKMLEFTRRVARDAGSGFTGHLSFDFLAEREGDDVELFPIECNPRAHTAVVLFQDTPEMAGAYLDIFNEDVDNGEDEEGDEERVVVPRTPTVGYYWVGHDFVTFLLIPLLSLVFGNGSVGMLIEGAGELLHHLLYWRDGTYAVSDPIPFWVLYHVYWPAQFIRSLVMDRRWSRINVSTTKMFSD